ncbi:MAG: formylglycine-generating enzyme family protein [Bacteroidales bacterium]|nr:formylglycine-generating enzyme family protein [Bacteroidales bacterium]
MKILTKLITLFIMLIYQNSIAQTIETFTVNGVEFDMVKVEHGSFQMGATPEQEEDADWDERFVHTVNITKDFYIGRFEVTQQLWLAVVDTLPKNMELLSDDFFGDYKPVVCVSWVEAKLFIKKLNQITHKNFKLPTEAQWEYSARGGKYGFNNKYSGSDDIKEVAWYWNNSLTTNLSRSTHQVGTKYPNELGIYDMSGNTWEWCEDEWYRYGSEPTTNPRHIGTSNSQRVYRGGGWLSNADGCRISKRSFCSPDGNDSNMGFRLAL